MSGGAAGGWTRAAMVVGGVARREDSVLLVHELTLGGEGPDQWVLPGGRLEAGELLDVAVKREVEEETGLKVASVGSLAFGSQHYAPGRDQPLLFLAFNVELASLPDAAFAPKRSRRTDHRGTLRTNPSGDRPRPERWCVPRVSVDSRLSPARARHGADLLTLGSEPVH